MRRQSRINLALLALVAGLGALTLYELRQGEAPPPLPLTTLQPDAIHDLRIVDTRGREIRLEKAANHWRMTAPYQVDANEPRIEQLLRIATTPSHARYPLPDAERLAEFGLAPGRLRLRLDELELVFGNTEPLQRYRYVRLGDALHLIGDGYYHHVLAPPEQYVSPRLLPEEADILAIRTRDWTLYKDTQGLWQIDPPVEGLSADRLNQRIADWQHAQALEVTAAPAETTPRTVHIELADRETPLRFEIVQDSAQLLLVRRDLGLGYRLPASLALLQPLRVESP